VSTSLDKTIKIWQTGHNKEVKNFEINDAGDGVWGAAFSPCGKYIAVSC